MVTATRTVAGSTLGAPAALAVVTAGALAVRWPLAVLVGLLAAVGVALMLLHIERSVLAYVAVEPFGDLVATLHPAAVKVAGGLLFVAWAVRLVLDARPVRLRHPGVLAAGALGLVVLASLVLQGASHEGATGIAVRYWSYLAVLVVLVDTIRGAGTERIVRVRRIASVFTLSCSAAAAVGLVGFLLHGGRAAGPLEDANDFAFFLVCAVPMALWLASGGARARWLYGVCAVVLVAGTLATFSRGALLALTLMVVLGVALGLVRLRVVAAGLAAVVLAVAVAWACAPEVIDRSLDEKQHVAASNVDSRFTSWEMAAAMTADRPLLGHGPGGFQGDGDRYVPAGTSDTTHLDVAHQMYLDVSSELGLLGLGAFLLVLGHGTAGAWRARRLPELAGAGTAVVVAMAGVLVAACFLSEQYYLPVWLLAALGISLDPRTAEEEDA